MQQPPAHEAFDYDHLQQNLVQRVVDQFHQLGYTILDASSEQSGPPSVTGRQHDSLVILPERLRAALLRLNPNKSEQLLTQAYNALTDDFSLQGNVKANRQIHQWLKNGYQPLSAQQNGGRATNSSPQQGQEKEATGSVQIIDWKEPADDQSSRNEFLVVRNLYVSSDIGRVRLDLVIFINGLPLILPLCQTARIYDLYNNYLTEYKRILPRLFWYNAIVILSNGPKSKLGSITASWEFFFEWNRNQNKQEDTATLEQDINSSLPHLLQGVCSRKNLLDIIENFILFSDEKGKTVKIIARNHQYLGVNAVFERLERHQELHGKLGVFWHTQGSGKSYSMVFLEQKVQRRLAGGWTFVIVTDREDLDTQIYETFQHAGIVHETKSGAHAADSQHLQRLLQQENHEIIFTLIQKFRTEKPGQKYELLSTRDNIVVLADEAHRTQYDTFAQNMLDGIPNASFLGFTGTPLIQAEKQATREHFGPYVSVYNFSDAIKDRITVPLFYENHTPEMGVQNQEFSEAIKQLIIDKQLNDEQERKFTTRLFREYSLLTNDERLDWVAEDIVAHFMERGYLGKAMVVSFDKPTTVRMYEKVQRVWRREMTRLEQLHQQESDHSRREAINRRLRYMRETDMAVIISEVAADDTRFEKYGVDIVPHMQRLKSEDLELAFKREDNLQLLAESGKKALRLAFVCGMWITGFDVPCLSTIYLDRPMEGHTLMQTIARANRVYDREKVSGLIVDYVGSFDDLLKALAVYAASDVAISQDIQVGTKSDLIKQLSSALEQIEKFCEQHHIDMQQTLQKLARTSDAAACQTIYQDVADHLLISEDSKWNYLSQASEVSSLYKAILPDKHAGDFTPRVYLLEAVAAEINDAMNVGNIRDALDEGRHLFAHSIELKSLVRETSEASYLPVGHFDLSKIDYDALAQTMREGHSNLKAEKLLNQLTQQLEQMVKKNPTRVDYQEKLAQIVHRNNDNSADNSLYPQELVDFARRLHEEELRARREDLSEEGLAIYDLITHIDLSLTIEDKEQIKKLTRELLASFHREDMGIEWQKKPQTRGHIQETIEYILGKLPPAYPKPAYDQKCIEVFQYTLTHIDSSGKSSA